MKVCNSCNKNKDEIFEILKENENHNCKACMSCYCKNREGVAFMVPEDVQIKDFHPMTNGRVFELKAIHIYDECESGKHAFLVDKETGRNIKYFLDTNWLLKIQR